MHEGKKNGSEEGKRTNLERSDEDVVRVEVCDNLESAT
jgi:hypothetical protein